MTQLWLVRHGESQGNVDGSQGDTPLSARGREQAARLAETLRGEVFDQVVSSPLIRARETASLALPEANLVIEEAIRELVVPPETFIDIHGLGPEELRALLDSARREHQGVETGLEFIARIKAWVAALPGDARVIAFTHFGVVRECLRLLGEGPAPQFIEHCEVHLVQV